MILVAYRHGLRASELVDLRWDQIDFNTATLAVRRAKKGSAATHPILGDELRALRRVAREQDPKSPFRVHLRAWCALDYGRIRPDGGACRRGC
jgi:type 1 fimbriae regulatory protein FimB/type 1 fimbriae regulatory protein FimE